MKVQILVEQGRNHWVWEDIENLKVEGEDDAYAPLRRYHAALRWLRRHGCDFLIEKPPTMFSVSCPICSTPELVVAPAGENEPTTAYALCTSCGRLLKLEDIPPEWAETISTSFPHSEDNLERKGREVRKIVKANEVHVDFIDTAKVRGAAGRWLQEWLDVNTFLPTATMGKILDVVRNITHALQLKGILPPFSLVDPLWGRGAAELLAISGTLRKSPWQGGLPLAVRCRSIILQEVIYFLATQGERDIVKSTFSSNIAIPILFFFPYPELLRFLYEKLRTEAERIVNDINKTLRAELSSKVYLWVKDKVVVARCMEDEREGEEVELVALLPPAALRCISQPTIYILRLWATLPDERELEVAEILHPQIQVVEPTACKDILLQELMAQFLPLANEFTEE